MQSKINTHITVRWAKNRKILDRGLIAQRVVLDKSPSVST